MQQTKRKMVFNTSFYSTDIVFNSYIFVTRTKDSGQKVSGGIKNFVVLHPQVSRQKSENHAYILLNISLVILFALKQHRKWNTRIFFLFLISYVYITCLSIRCQCVLENHLNDLKVCSKKFFFFFWVTKNMRQHFFKQSRDEFYYFLQFIIANAKNQDKYFTLILLISKEINPDLNPGPSHNS